MTTHTISGSLYGILNWLKTSGEVRATDRLRVIVLPVLLQEGIFDFNFQVDTTCSPECLQAVKLAAEQIVGAPCPN